MSKDYYKILEISRNASEEEIKKAYKRQALKFHPDKNANPEAEDKFKLIAEAYVVLTDSDKRRTHDGAEETFNNPTYSSTTSPKNWPQDPPIKQTLYISLEDLANGVTKKMRILRKVMQLDGSVTLEDKILQINVQPHYKSGTTVTFEKEGDQIRGRIPADVVFVISIKAHPHFRRVGVGCNVKYTCRITVKQVLCGRVIQIPTLTNERITLDLSKEINRLSSVKKYSGRGLPNPKNPERKGDLLVSFDLKFPENLSQSVKDMINNTLPNC